MLGIFLSRPSLKAPGSPSRMRWEYEVGMELIFWGWRRNIKIPRAANPGQTLLLLGLPRSGEKNEKCQHQTFVEGKGERASCVVLFFAYFSTASWWGDAKISSTFRLPHGSHLEDRKERKEKLFLIVEMSWRGGKFSSFFGFIGMREVCAVN